MESYECACCKVLKPQSEFGQRVVGILNKRVELDVTCIQCRTASDRGNKVCRRCKQEKPVSEFGKQAAQKDGLHIYCKQCNSKASVAWKKANPEKHTQHEASRQTRSPDHVRLLRNAAAKRWRVNHPEQFEAIWQRRNTERRMALKAEGSDKDITITGVHSLDKGVCQLCGEECSLDDATVDHDIPVSAPYNGSHTWDNVQLAHFSCNSSKGNRTTEEYLKGLPSRRRTQEIDHE